MRGVTVTKTGSGAIVVSAKSERKRGISAQKHKPAGRKPHFYLPFNFDFLTGEVPSLPSDCLAVSRS